MKNLLTCILGLIITCGTIQYSMGQEYSLSIYTIRLALEDEQYDGYTTSFTQEFKEVKKAWWRYANSRMIIFNKKTHLVLTIPAKRREANAPLIFASQLIENKEGGPTKLNLALMGEGIPEDQIEALKVQTKSILKDFKISYFTGLLQQKIEESELASKKMSMEMDKYLLDNVQLQQWILKKPEQKEKFLARYSANTKKIEALQANLTNQQHLLSQHKKELTLIK